MNVNLELCCTVLFALYSDKSHLLSQGSHADLVILSHVLTSPPLDSLTSPLIIPEVRVT